MSPVVVAGVATVPAWAGRWATVTSALAPDLASIPSPLLVGLSLAALVVAGGRAWESQAAGEVRERLDPTAPSRPPGWFAQALELSGLEVDLVRGWRWSVRAAIVAGALVAWHRPVVAAVLVMGAGAAVAARRQVRRGVEHREHHQHLAAVIDVVLFRLAAGSSLASAIEGAAREPTALADDLARVAARIHHGLGVQAAVDEWATTAGSAAVRLLADAVAIAGVSGGSQQAALLGVQATLRDRDALAREVRALAAQARTSGVVLVVAPIAFALVVALIDPGVAAFFATPAGWGCVVVGLGLDVAGATWMRRLAGAVE